MMLKCVFGASILAFAMLGSCGNAQPRNNLIPALQRLAETNNPEAIYYLGMAYQTGSGIPHDRAKALAAFRRAAGLGDVLASYKLGCYYDGQGEGLIESDPELALRYKLVAAEAGYALAQQDVAVLYARRDDLPTALTWFERAAAQGWSDALAAYASVHNGAPGVPPDRAKTAAFFRLFLSRVEPSEEQVTWLAEFEKTLSNADRERAAKIVAGYEATPTAITLKALSGQRAAEEFVSRGR
jgi:uncharacterized protein